MIIFNDMVNILFNMIKYIVKDRVSFVCNIIVLYFNKT